ncbi:MAG: EamA family transporter [Dehalococcoidales bacterium]
MEWVWLALLSTGVCSVAVIVQKRCLEHHVRSAFSYGTWAAVVQVLLSMTILLIEPLPLRLSWPVMLALSAGVVRALSLAAQYKGLQAESEVSRAVPLLDSYPVFVAILAVVFLGQSLTPSKWLAISLVIAGAILISQHRLFPGGAVRSGRSFLYLLSGSVGVAGFVTLASLALESLSCWQVFAVSTLSSAVVLLGTCLGADVGREVSLMTRRTRTLGLIILAEVLLAVSVVIYFVAITRGPISLVAAVTATRPLMVLIFNSLLSVMTPQLFPERLYRPIMVQKLLAVSMVTVGLAVMSLVR